MKKLINRTTSLLLALLLVAALCLSGCGGADDPAAETEPITVAIVQPMSHTSLNQIRDTIVAQLEASGLNFEIETLRYMCGTVRARP